MTLLTRRKGFYTFQAEDVAKVPPNLDITAPSQPIIEQVRNDT